jgi:CDP-diacylglycerol--glycerol-3-phosphate 3-phosphatidyltransferase
MSFADQLTLARAAAVPIVIVLFVWDFPNHNYWATAVFAVAMATDWFDGRLARRSGRTSALGSLLDPVADKLLVLTVMILLVGEGVFPGWMVALIVARELLVSGLRLAALERGTVLHARDLGRLKTWTQAVAAGLGGLAAAGAFDDSIAVWALAVALALTWISGLDYAVGPAATAERSHSGFCPGHQVVGVDVLEQSREPPDASVAVGGLMPVRERLHERGALLGRRLRRDLDLHPGGD